MLFCITYFHELPFIDLSCTQWYFVYVVIYLLTLFFARKKSLDNFLGKGSQ